MTINELQAVSQPYPASRPWIDLSGFLINGAASFAAGSVAALADGNLIHYAIRIRTDDVSDSGSAQQRRRFLEGVPQVLCPATNTPVFADLDGDPVSVQVLNSGNIQINAASGRFLTDARFLGFTLTTLRSIG